MSERITSHYRRVFEVRLLHHYWLDDGATVFDQIADPDKKNARLLAYDVRAFLVVVPAPATAEILRGFRCLFKETALGFVVAAPGSAAIPSDAVFQFVVSIKSSQVFDYTALTLRPQKIYELFNSQDGITYRYKENVPVLSNLTGVLRGAGPNTTLFLSREIPAQTPGDQVESLVVSGVALLQLTSDSPAATTRQLAAHAADFPVFVNQADAPVIVPPVGLVGAPARGLRLSDDVTDDVFALISLTAVRGDNDAFSFVDGAGSAKAPAPVYHVRFKNRSTVWTYMNKTTGAVDSINAGPLPLTYFGNAGAKQKPSRGHVKAEMSGTKVTRLISEIYV